MKMSPYELQLLSHFFCSPSAPLPEPDTDLRAGTLESFTARGLIQPLSNLNEHAFGLTDKGRDLFVHILTAAGEILSAETPTR
jgi:hypothetical protein